MAQQTLQSAVTKRTLSWVGILLMILMYIFMYAVNFWFPPGWSNYTSRIWDWSQITLTLIAWIVVIVKRQNLSLRLFLLGLVLGAISAFSHSLHDPDLWSSLKEGLAVWV
jgi:hypothetical protein